MDKKYKILEFSQLGDERGHLVVIEGNKDIPFEIKRLFYICCMGTSKFSVDNNCNSCGLCTKVCPFENIELYKGKPMWHQHCTKCMACICRCPKEAIQYGKSTKNKGRYYNPLLLKDKEDNK